MDESRIKELESHSQMLGQIAAHVEDFAYHEDMTTLDGVKLLLADYHKYKGIAERYEIEEKYGL
jgi:hypothetical protein